MTHLSIYYYIDIRSSIFSFFFLSLILYPVWMIGWTTIGVMIRAFSVMILFFVILEIMTYTDTKIENDQLATLGMTSIIVLLISIIGIIVIFFQYLSLPVTSGGDEISHIAQSLKFYSLLTLGHETSLVFRFFVFVIFGFTFVVSTYFYHHYNSHIKKYLNISQRLKIAVGIALIFGLIGGFIFYYLQTNGLFLDPYLPYILIRFPPVKGILGSFLLSVIGLNYSMLRLINLIFVSLALFEIYNITREIIPSHQNKWHEISLGLLVIIVAVILILNPIFIEFCLVFYQTSGELYFFILTAKYAIRYLRFARDQDLYLLSLVFSISFLFRRSFLFMLPGIFLTFLLINVNYKHYNDGLKFQLKENSHFLLLPFTIPIIIISYWFVNLYSSPLRGEFLAVPQIDFKNLALRRTADQNLFDYFEILVDHNGVLLPMFTGLCLIYMLKNSQTRKIALFFITIIGSWYFGITIYEWVIRIPRFVLVYTPLMSTISVISILQYTSESLVGSHKKKIYILNFAKVTFLFLLLLNYSISTHEERNKVKNRETEYQFYPFEDLSKFLESHYLDKGVFIPWRGLNPMGLYKLKYHLTQEIVRGSWLPPEHQNLTTLVQYMYEINALLLVLPQLGSEFNTRDNILLIEISNQILSNQTNFILVKQFRFEDNELFLFELF